MRADEDLQRQLVKLATFLDCVLESIPSSVVVINRQLRIVSANQNFLNKGYREVQSTIGERLESVFPTALVEYMRLIRKVQEVFHTGRSMEGERVSYRAPGLPTRIYFYRLVPLQSDGKVENVMLLMDDITKQERLDEEVRRVERHLASVVECANDLVVSLDPEGRIITWNHAAGLASGMTSEEAKNKPLYALCAEGVQHKMKDRLQKLGIGEAVQDIEVPLQNVAGHKVPIAWSFSAMRDDAGQIVGLVAVGRDLTELRRLETQLMQSARIASLGVMAGGIAHELRNPLGIISANAQLLQQRFEDPALADQCLDKIYQATKRASLIIENLLKFARQGGERFTVVDVEAVLQETIALLANQVVLENVALVRDLRAGPVTVYGNAEMLQQVFTNLILNACNAMPKGGELTIVSRCIAEGLLEISFRDTGCGIAEENLPKIFDPFYTTMPVGQGTGLGLSISFSIIQHHHGTIEVSSEMGQGTTVSIRLPLLREKDRGDENE